MTFLTFTHANLGRPVEVSASLIFSFYYSESHKCVFLVASGGAIIPVSESLEVVREKVQAVRV